jgi:alpha-ribazole phosphatase
MNTDRPLFLRMGRPASKTIRKPENLPGDFLQTGPRGIGKRLQQPRIKTESLDSRCPGIFFRRALEMPEELILIRHGEVGEEHRGVFIGKTDVPLSSKGKRQADRLRMYLESRPRAVILSSPLRRCMETAEIAAEPLGLRVEVDEDLCEIDFGRWECLSFDEIAAANAGAVEGWARYDRDFAFPGGERIGDFLDRISRVGNRLVSHGAESAIAFTHGGVIRALICHFLKLAPRNYLLFEVSPASVTSIRLFKEGGVLTGLNMRCHLEGA